MFAMGRTQSVASAGRCREIVFMIDADTKPDQLPIVLRLPWL